jgi:hypothetical protein
MVNWFGRTPSPTPPRIKYVLPSTRLYLTIEQLEKEIDLNSGVGIGYLLKGIAQYIVIENKNQLHVLNRIMKFKNFTFQSGNDEWYTIHRMLKPYQSDDNEKIYTGKLLNSLEKTTNNKNPVEDSLMEFPENIKHNLEILKIELASKKYEEFLTNLSQDLLSPPQTKEEIYNWMKSIHSKLISLSIKNIRVPDDKPFLNQVIQELKQLLVTENAESIKNFESNMKIVIELLRKEINPALATVLDELEKYEYTAENPLIDVSNILNILQKLQGSENTGGAPKKHKYKGRSYKVRTGKRGGKYITVNDKKIYI